MNDSFSQGKDLVKGNGENVLNILVIKQNETNNCGNTRNNLQHCPSAWSSTYSNLSTTVANNDLASDAGILIKSNKQRAALYKSQSFTVVEAQDAAVRKRKMTSILKEVDQAKHKQHEQNLDRQILYRTEIYKKDKIQSSSPLHTSQGGLKNLVKSVSHPLKPPDHNQLQFSASPVLISSNLRNSSIQSLNGSPTSIQSNKMVFNAGTVQNHQLSPFWILNDCSGVSSASIQNLMKSPLCHENVKASPDSGFCTPSQEVRCSPPTSTPIRPQSHFQDTIKSKLLSNCFSTDSVLSEQQDDSMSSELCIVDHSEDSVDSVASVAYSVHPQADGQSTLSNETTPQLEDCHSAEQQKSVGSLMYSNIVLGSDYQLKTVASNYQGSKALTEAQEKLLERPIYSYMDLIKMALNDSEVGEMTLKEILAWIENHFPYFKMRAKKSWKSSIRHNLSLHPDFIKVEDKKHAGKWKVVADAKKYRAKPPKPQVVKCPEQPEFFKRSRREGPQPILPKSVPFALVPLPFSFGQHIGQPLGEQISRAVSLQLGRSIDQQLRQVDNQRLILNAHQQLRQTGRKPVEQCSRLEQRPTRKLVPKVHHQLRQPFSTHLGFHPPVCQQIILPAESSNVSHFLQQPFEQLTTSNVQIQSLNSLQGNQSQPIILFPSQVLDNQQLAAHPNQDLTLSNQGSGQYILQPSLYHVTKDEQMSFAKATADQKPASHMIADQSVQQLIPQDQGGPLEPVKIQIMNGDNENEKKIIFVLNPKMAGLEIPKTSSFHVSDGQQNSNFNFLGTRCRNKSTAETSLRSNTYKGRKTSVKKRAGKTNNNFVKAGVAHETSQKPYMCQHTERNPQAPVFNLEASLQEPNMASDVHPGQTLHEDVIESDCEVTSSQQVCKQAGECDSAPQHCIIRQAWAQVYSKWTQDNNSNVSEYQASDIDGNVSQHIVDMKTRSAYSASLETSPTNSNLTDQSSSSFSKIESITGHSSHVSAPENKTVSKKVHGCSRKLLILQNQPKHKPKDTDKNADKENSLVEKITERRLQQRKLPLLSINNTVNNISRFQPYCGGDNKSSFNVTNNLDDERVPAISHLISDSLDLLKSPEINVINKVIVSVASSTPHVPNTAPSSSSQLRTCGPSRRKQVIIPLTTEISPRRMLQSSPGDKERHNSTPTLQPLSANSSPHSASPRDRSGGDTFFQDNGNFYPSHSSAFHGSPNPPSHAFLSSSPPSMSYNNMNISLSPPHNLSHFLSLTMTPPPGGQSVSLTSTPKHCQENTSFLDSSLLDMSLLENLESLMQNTSWTQLKTP